MEHEIPKLPPVWEHSLTTLLGHDPTTTWNSPLTLGTLPESTQPVGSTQLGPSGTQNYSCQTGILPR